MLIWFQFNTTHTEPTRLSAITTGRKTIPLVLGGSGARGLAHIGVIQWLNENGYDIWAIAGTCMGALIGGSHATQKLQIYIQSRRGTIGMAAS